MCSYPNSETTFIREGALTKHNIIHSGECTYALIENVIRNLHLKIIRHNRIHTSERPYICTYPECNKRFKESNHLICHNRIRVRLSKMW